MEEQVACTPPHKSEAKIHNVMQDADSTCEEIKEALLEMSFNRAPEDFKTGERGRLTTLEPRQAIEKLDRLAKRITRTVTCEQEVRELMVVVEARLWLVPALKSYVDLSKT